MQQIFAVIIVLTFSISSVLCHGDDSHFPNQQDVTVKTTRVSGNVYMLQGRGGNVGALVGNQIQDQGNFLFILSWKIILF